MRKHRVKRKPFPQSTKLPSNSPRGTPLYMAASVPREVTDKGQLHYTPPVLFVSLNANTSEEIYI